MAETSAAADEIRRMIATVTGPKFVIDGTGPNEHCSFCVQEARYRAAQFSWCGSLDCQLQAYKALGYASPVQYYSTAPWERITG